MATTALGWYPDAVPLRITTGEYTTTTVIPRVSVCNHITDGSDSRNHLQNVKNDASVHFLIRIENGRAVVYQFMSIFWSAWGNGRHSGIGNPYMPAWIKEMVRLKQPINEATISIEHEGDYPSALPFPQIMIDASIKLHKWICAQVPTIKKDRDHIIGHYQIDHVDRAFCPGGPGGLRFPFDTIVAALNAGTTVPSVVVNGYNIVGGFLDLWNKHGLPVMGLPISNEYSEVIPALGNKAVTFQDFENVIIEYYPGIQARIGAGIRRYKYHL